MHIPILASSACFTESFQLKTPLAVCAASQCYSSIWGKLFEFVLLLGTKGTEGTEHWKRLMKLLMNMFRFEASLVGYHQKYIHL